MGGIERHVLEDTQNSNNRKNSQQLGVILWLVYLKGDRALAITSG